MGITVKISTCVPRQQREFASSTTAHIASDKRVPGIYLALQPHDGSR